MNNARNNVITFIALCVTVLSNFCIAYYTSQKIFQGISAEDELQRKRVIIEKRVKLYNELGKLISLYSIGKRFSKEPNPESMFFILNELDDIGMQFIAYGTKAQIIKVAQITCEIECLKYDIFAVERACRGKKAHEKKILIEKFMYPVFDRLETIQGLYGDLAYLIRSDLQKVFDTIIDIPDEEKQQLREQFDFLHKKKEQYQKECIDVMSELLSKKNDSSE